MKECVRLGLLFRTDPVSFMDYPADIIVRLIETTAEVTAEMRDMKGEDRDG